VIERRLGNHLKEARTRLGLTQTELAERIGVSRKTINTVENSVFVPSTTLALMLARILETTVEELFYVIDSED
jgi:putative transcriptional regulator